MANCQARDDFAGLLIECGRSPAEPAYQACRCGHPREGGPCSWPRSRLDGALCLKCHDLPGGQAHDCPLTLRGAEAVSDRA